jgi:ribosomal-protein-alanine N-acetyltransferase
MVHLAAGDVVVREWRRSDAEELALLANDRRVSANLRDAFPYPYGYEDACGFIEMAAAQDPPTVFAIEHRGALAGGIGYRLHTDVERVGAEVGYWVAHRYWGRGIGTAALRTVTGHAFRAHAGLRRLYAVPFAGNDASARILEKAGYRLEGTLRQSAIKDGTVLDQWMYAILREEWQDRLGEKA